MKKSFFKNLTRFQPCITMVLMVCCAMLLSDMILRNGVVIGKNTIGGYVVGVIVIVLTFSIILVGLKLFRYSRVLNQMKQPDVYSAHFVFHRWSALRMATMVLVCLVDCMAYLLTGDVSMWWCAIVVMLAGFFCVPTESKFLDILDKLEKKEK